MDDKFVKEMLTEKGPCREGYNECNRVHWQLVTRWQRQRIVPDDEVTSFSSEGPPVSLNSP